MKSKTMDQKSNNASISMLFFTVCFTVTIFFYNVMYSVAQNTRYVLLNKLSETNVRIYGAGLVLFFFLFVSMEFLAGRRVPHCMNQLEYSTVSLNQVSKWAVSLIPAAIGFGLFVKWGFVDQWKEVGVSNNTFYDYPMLFRVLLTLVAGIVVAGKVRMRSDISQIELYSIYAFSVMITIMQLYINPFASIYSSGDSDFTMAIYDNTSITESIYNVYDLVPYNNATSSLYGHYGLLFLAPLRLIGRANPETVVALLVCGGSIAQLATIYIIDQYSPKRWIAGLLCLAAVIRTAYGYMAVSPMRTMWPLIMSAFIVFVVKHGNKRLFVFIGYVISMLSIIWNTETGIACAFGFAAFSFFIRNRRTDSKAHLPAKALAFVENSLALIAGVFFPLTAAVLAINIYNYCCGARIFLLKEFFYPYAVRSFMNGSIRCNPPAGNHAWVYIMALLLSIIAWGIKREWFSAKTYECERSDDPLCAMSMACIGVVAFSYYMNEAHWGCMEIVHQLCIGLIAIILGKLYKTINTSDYSLSNLILRGIAILSIAVSLSLAVNVYNDPVRFAARNHAGAYSFKVFHQDVEQLKNEIPENTFGIGQGISMIYHTIGWDNHLKFRDTSALTIDQTGEVFDAAVSEVLKNDTFLITDHYYDQAILNTVLKRDLSYQKIKTVSVNGWNYCLYSRNEQLF